MGTCSLLAYCSYYRATLAAMYLPSFSFLLPFLFLVFANTELNQLPRIPHRRLNVLLYHWIKYEGEAGNGEKRWES